MWQTIANIILRNRLIIIGIIAVITAFFGYRVSQGLKMDNRYGILVPNNVPAANDYEKFRTMFGEDGGTLVLAVKTDSLYTETNFLKWKELGDSILQLDGVESVVSEATLFTISNNKKANKFEAHRVFSDTKYGEKSIDSIQGEIKNNPLYDGLLFNDEGVSLLMIGIEEDYINENSKKNIVIKIEELGRSYSQYFGSPKYAGLPHLRVIIAKHIQEELVLFIGLLILSSGLLLYLFFRSFKVVVICLAVVAIAVIWSMGTMSVLGYSMSVMTALIPPLMIVIGIPNCVFLFTKYHQELFIHGNKVKALTRVVQKIGTATFLTNFTTALGFLTFVTTNSPKLIEFGICASVNIILLFIISICVLPIICSLTKTPRKKHLKHLERKLATGLLNSLVNISVNHRRWVYIVTIAIVVLSVLGIMQIRVGGRLTGDLPKEHHIYQDFTFIQNNFGGSIPYEILIDYKEPSRLTKASTLKKIEQIQEKYASDTTFSKFISYVDFLKVANMAYHDNDSTQYKLITSKRKLGALKRYIDNSVVTNSSGIGIGLKELVDTSKLILRIRTQAKDLDALQISDKAAIMKVEIDSILNPDRAKLEHFYAKYEESNKSQFVDSIIFNHPPVYNGLTKILSNSDDNLQFEFDSDPELIKTYYSKKKFKENLRKAIDDEYFDITMTGTSILASNGTQYMVINLITSLLFAVIAISILMSILFRSARMVFVSLIPNLIPLLFTAGIMGWFGIPLKPSTLLVFSIAFGISIDDTIHYLAKYRLELKTNQWDLKQCVIKAIREAGLGMFYTSIVLFFGFSMFSFSMFGGTKALGLLISLTLLIAMITNLVVLPTLLLSLERRLTTKSFEEPYFDAYAEESDLDWENLNLEKEVSEVTEEKSTDN